MIKNNKIYLITSNAEAGTLETLPLTDNIEIVPNDQLFQTDLSFEVHQKVCITSETSIELITNRIDITRANAIKALKDKFIFRQILSEIYPNYQYELIQAHDIPNIDIKKKAVIKPIKGCFGTAVRVIEPNTDFKQLSLELSAELNKNGSIFSESVLSKENFILEQYIDGEEYAVDMFYNSKGEPCIINIYHHPMPMNKSYLHMIYYSSKTVFDTIYEKAKLFFIELNKILGVTNFVMHSEFKLDGDDLMPIEINSMRFGGMGLGNLVFHSLNVNPYTYFQNDTEPDWGNIWNKNESNIFAFFIAYNSENKSVMEYKPNREKLKKQFTHVLLEQVFDYKKQLAFAIYCLKETNENIEKLLKIEFDDYFEQSLTFKKISIIDNCGLTSPEIEKISMLSQEPISIYNDFPETETQIIERIGDADCVLVSWQTMINADILKASTSLKFIGMCCSLYDENSANVDITEARKLGIEVKGVKDYGDEGTVEFIFAQLIYLLKGLGKHQWKSEGTELSNKSIGIVGLGTLGQMVAKTAIHFGMNVFYFNRSRKHELEKEGITYLPLNELVKSCDIITTHLPKNTILLNALEFQNKKENSILVNTSLGLTFDKDAFLKWISNDKTSFAILDADGVGNFGREFSEYQNIITTDQFAGFTIEAKKRLSEKVLANLTNYLEHK